MFIIRELLLKILKESNEFAPDILLGCLLAREVECRPGQGQGHSGLTPHKPGPSPGPAGCLWPGLPWPAQRPRRPGWQPPGRALLGGNHLAGPCWLTTTCQGPADWQPPARALLADNHLPGPCWRATTWQGSVGWQPPGRALLAGNNLVGPYRLADRSSDW